MVYNDSNTTGLKLSDIAYQKLKESICSGEFSIDDVWSESKIAKKLYMSRSPVHQAVKRLEKEGFLEIKPAVGIFVRNITEEEIANIYEIRIELEVLAARTSIANIKKSELVNLEVHFCDLLARHRAGLPVSPVNYLTLDLTLHNLIINYSNNAYIKIIMKMLEPIVVRYQRTSFIALNDLSTSIYRHLEIIDILKNKNSSLLTQTLKNNINLGKEILLKKK